MHELLLPPYIGLILFIVVLATEAIIELVKESEISLYLIHTPIFKLHDKYNCTITYVLYKYVTCGQCMSVVYSIPGAVIITSYVIQITSAPFWYTLVWFIVFWFFVQRSTNWLNTSYKILSRGRVTTVQFVEPLIEVNKMSRINMMDRDSVFDREFNKPKPIDVVINNLSDIKSIISKLKVDKSDDGMVLDVKIGDSNFKINSSTNHPTYMQIISDMLNEDLDTDDTFIPINNGEKLVPPSVTTSDFVNRFVNRLTGGVADKNRIRWDINYVSYFYDPKYDVLTMKSDD